MAACSPVKYNNVNSEVFNGLKSELEKKGFTVPGTKGTISGPFGLLIEYEWDEDQQTLHTHVLEKNFFISCSQVNDQLSNALSKHMA